MLNDHAHEVDLPGIFSLENFVRYVIAISPNGPDFNVSSPIPEPPQINPSTSGVWNWLKRQLNNELMLLGINMTRIHISRSYALDMGETKLWNTEIEMFTSFTESEIRRMGAVSMTESRIIFTKDLLDLAPNGGVISWNQVQTQKQRQKGDNLQGQSYGSPSYFLYGDDQIAFIPLENLSMRKIFLTVSGPSFDINEYNKIRATALNFMSRYM